MKNILAENLLRFGLKNADATVVNKLQSLAEAPMAADATHMSAALLIEPKFGDIKLQPGSEPVVLKDTIEDGPAVLVFNIDNVFNGSKATNSGDCVVYRIDLRHYVVIGQIGVFDEKSKSVNNAEFGAIVLRPYVRDNMDGIARPIKYTPAGNIGITIVRIAQSILQGPDSKDILGYLTRSENGKALVNGISSVYSMLGKSVEEEKVLAMIKQASTGRTSQTAG
jgi:hypothetical protein